MGSCSIHSFPSDFFDLASIFWDSLTLLYASIVHSFLVLSSIPLDGWKCTHTLSLLEAHNWIVRGGFLRHFAIRVWLFGVEQPRKAKIEIPLFREHHSASWAAELPAWITWGTKWKQPKEHRGRGAREGGSGVMAALVVHNSGFWAQKGPVLLDAAQLAKEPLLNQLRSLAAMGIDEQSTQTTTLVCVRCACPHCTCAWTLYWYRPA